MKIKTIKILSLLCALTLMINGCSLSKTPERSYSHLRVQNPETDEYSDDVASSYKSERTKEEYKKLIPDEDKLLMIQSTDEWYDYVNYYLEMADEDTVIIDEELYIKEYPIDFECARYKLSQITYDNDTANLVFVDFIRPMVTLMAESFEPTLNAKAYNHQKYIKCDYALLKHIYDMSVDLEIINNTYFD